MVILVAATSLALLSGAASGVETLPENTAAPTISPITPIEGKTETASAGTWNGSPTSFTYAWYRCSGTEACASISSANASTYVPTHADLTKALRVQVTASNTIGSGSAISAASSAVIVSPPPYYWNSCKKTGTGEYTNSTCSVFGSGGFAWTKLAEAASTAFSATGGPFVLKIPFGEAQMVIKCTGQNSEGTLQNPSGAGSAVVSSTSFKMSGCTVQEPSTCSVSGGLVTFVSLKGTTVQFGDNFSVKFEPGSGTNLTTITIQKGSGACALTGSYVLAGSFIGIDNPLTSSLEITKASSEGILIGAKPVTLEGTTKIQTVAGEALKLTP
jgi:hypothetical protein